MRLLIVNHHRSRVGGIETYLAAIMPALRARGHELLFVYEADAAADLIPAAETISSAEQEKLNAWRPEMAYLHAVHDLDFQAAVIGRYPTAAFAHGYYGLCISGNKTWRRGRAQPCSKNFDWKCLFHFHARGCGGMNPITMLRDYSRQTRQLALLKNCDRVLTHGAQMHQEYLAQGISPDRLATLPHFVSPPAAARRRSDPGPIAKLVYAGRFDPLKGGQLLLEALPLLQRPVDLLMIGSGPAESAWRQIAQRVASPDIRVHFKGWLDRAAKDALVAESDLLVMPSLWPEPFGQSGLEATALGVPAVAYNSGGVPAWLRDGVNGHLAAADPPTPESLAKAIRKSLGNPAHYAKLSAGAIAVAGEFSLDRHLDALTRIFEAVLNRAK